MTLWDQLTLATRYEAVLHDNLEVVKEKLTHFENMKGRAVHQKYRVHLLTSKEKARQRFRIIQSYRSSGTVLYEAYLAGYIETSEALDETRIFFRAYPSRITLFAATVVFVVISRGLLNEKVEGLLPLFFILGIEFLWFYSLFKSRDDLYHRIVELTTTHTSASELMNTSIAKLLHDISNGSVPEQQEAALNLGLLIERHRLPDPSQLQLLPSEYRHIQLSDEDVVKIVKSVQQVLLEQTSPNPMLFWAIGKAKTHLAANVLFSLIEAIGEHLDGAAAYQAIIALDNVVVMAAEKPHSNYMSALKSFLTRMSASDDRRSSEVAYRILSRL